MNEQQSIQIETLLKVTTLIVCKEGRRTVGRGTGFFFQQSGKIYLITNRHVLVNEQQNFYPDKIIIRLNCDPGDITKSKELPYFLYKDDAPVWKELSEKIDLAALEIPQPDKVIFSALSKANLLPDDVQLGLGEQVLVVGYPKGFYDEMHNLPIVRNASIASAYGVYFKNNPFFLIDAILHPGTSGSPVFTVPKNMEVKKGGGFVIGGMPKWYFIGVNSGEFGEMQLNEIWYASLVIKLIESS
jgi:hypothetical protein